MAQIDASIPLAVRPPQIEGPMNALMQYTQLQGAQQQNALAGMRMQELERARTQDETIRAGLQDPNADPAQVYMRAGRPKESIEISTAQRLKEKAGLEAAMQKLTVGAQFLSTAKDQPTYDAARQSARDAGLDISRMPPQFDPTFVATSLKQSMSVKDQMEQAWKQADYDLRQRTQTNTEQHQRATLAETARGHDLTDQRARETLSKPYEVTDPDTGQPVLVQQGADGKPRRVEGYGPKGGGKPLPQAALKQITEVRDNAVTIDRLASSFKPEFAGKGVLGIGADTQLDVSGRLGADKDSVEWWKNYRKESELVERHAMFGAALSQGEQASWRSADIGPGMDAEVIKRNLATRKKLAQLVLDNARQDLIDAGHNPERINAIANRTPGGTQTTTSTTAPTATVHRVTNAADYAKVPPGEAYVAPDGQTRRKPK